MLKIRSGDVDLAFIRRPTAKAVLDTYRQMSMTLPALDGPRERAVATRARAMAARNGWAPPLAWNNIDDPQEDPQNWHYQAGDRVEALRDFDEHGLGISEAARRLHTSREALERYAARHGISDVYSRMVAREYRAVSQWDGGVGNAS